MTESKSFFQENRVIILGGSAAALLVTCSICLYFDQVVYKPNYGIADASTEDVNSTIGGLFPFDSAKKNRYSQEVPNSRFKKLGYKFGKGVLGFLTNSVMSSGPFGLDMYISEDQEMPTQVQLDHFLFLVRNMTDKNINGYSNPIISGHFGIPQDIDTTNPIESGISEGIANSDLDDIYKMDTFWAAYTSRALDVSKEPAIAKQIRQFGAYLLPVRVGIASYYAKKGVSYQDYVAAVKGRTAKVLNKVVELDPMSEERYRQFSDVVRGNVSFHLSNELLAEYLENPGNIKSRRLVEEYLNELGGYDFTNRVALGEEYAKYGHAV